jgi:hypothetical protein
MRVGRRGRLTKEETDKIQYDIHTNGVKDSRKETEQRKIEYSMGTRTTKQLFLLLSS